MDFKLIGCILLIVGTSIGAGMLGLPIATAQLGFWGSALLLIVCWLIMTAGAFLILEVNLWLPKNSNLISMAGATVGPVGQVISWVTYLLLLYSLLCAYIAGGSDLFHNLLLTNAINFPLWLSALIFTFIFSTIVYWGIRSVDYVNRGLMFFKLGSYFLLIVLLAPFISLDKLAVNNTPVPSTMALMVTMTAFGYASIIPSLRVYFNDDIKKLRVAILAGSLIPLVCYIFWDAVIMGVIPLDGQHGLLSILQAKNSTSDLVNTLNAQASEGTVTFFVKLFTSICVLTSFLGVGICLTDFLADGFKVEKKGKAHLFIHLLTFIPPLIIVLFVPNAFIKALEYAGIYCVILLILLPAWMAWRGRYHRLLTNDFRVWGGKFLLTTLIVFSLAMIARGVVG